VIHDFSKPWFPQKPHRLEGTEIELNGIKWSRIPGVRHKVNYYEVFETIMNPPEGVDEGAWEREQYRHLFLNDLWALVYFGLRVPVAYHKFWIQACWEVQDGPRTNTLDIWAREHGKSTIITVADSIHRLLRDPNERIALFSYSKPAAQRFVRQIKWVLEDSAILKACFPDIFYENPAKESPKWSEEVGLVIKRSTAAAEPSISGHGLLEGMPTGSHFSRRLYDDIEVHDFVNNPDVITKLKESFDMSQNLGTVDGTHGVTGTPYHHFGLLQALREKKLDDGTPVYHLRLKPATVDGAPNGESVYLPEKKLAELRTNKQFFYSQQLLDPTPRGEEKLNSAYLKEVMPSQIPKNLFKFMVIDPAGYRKDRTGDSWGILVCGVEPFRDDLGASNIYILDAVIEPLAEAEAMDIVTKVYLRNGRILRLGVEKVSMQSMEIHVANALRAKGRSVTVEGGSLVILRPGGRSKEERILSNLQWPLNNGKLHISSSIPKAYIERLRLEMSKFPYWHDDGLDALAYLFDVFRDYRFGARPPDSEPAKPRIPAYVRDRDQTSDGWILV
jgi:hypothetical protein